MTDNKKKDPVGSITISSDHQPKRTVKKKKEETLQPEGKDFSTSLPTTSPQKKGKGKPRNPKKRKIPTKKTSVLFWIAFCLIILLAGYSLGGFMVLPYLLQTSLSDALSRKIDRSVTIGKASFNPFTMQCSLNNAIIGPVLSDPEDKIDPLCSVGRLQFSISPLSLFKKKLRADDVTMDHFFLHLVRTGDKQYNISRLIQKKEASDYSAKQDSLETSLPFLLTNISAKNSRVLFDDQPAKKNHVIEDIFLTFPFFFHNKSSEGKPHKAFAETVTLIQPQFSAVINGSPIEFSGDTSITDKGLEAKLRLQLDNIDLPDYLNYLPTQPGFNIDKGTASGALDLVFLSPPDAKPQLEIKGNGKLLNIQFRDMQGHLTTFPEVTVSGSFLPLDHRYHFSEVQIDKSEFHVSRQKDGSWTFPELLEVFTLSEQEPRQTLLSINLLKINGGKLSFTDQYISGSVTHSLSDIQVTLKNLSTEKAISSSYVLSGTLHKKGKIACQGELFLSPFHMQGLLIANNFNAAQLSPYLSFGKDVKITKGQFPKLETHFDLSRSSSSKKQPNLILTGLSTELIDFNITHKNKKHLVLPKAVITLEQLNSSEKNIQLTKIDADNPYIAITWDKKGISNWNTFFQATANSGAAPWHITLPEADIKNGSIHFEDNTWEHPFRQTLNKVTTKITGLGDQQNKPANITLSGSSSKGGALNINGSFTLSPFAADLDCALEKYPLSNSSPLLQSWLTPQTYTGTVKAAGKVSLPGFTYQGSLEIADFIASGPQNKKIISLKKGTADALVFSRKNNKLSINSAKIDYPYLNWTQRTKSSSHGGVFVKTSPKKSSKSLLTINKIELKSGTLDYIDTRISPTFKSSTTLSGTIAQVTNETESLAKISLKGASPNNNAVTVLGDIGLLQKNFSCDVTTEISNQDIMAISPYLQNISGDKIKKGKFDLLARYQQKDGKVDGNHSIVFSDFTLGATVGQTRQLPITLALLTDQSGSLALELPITGNANEKSYSYPSVVTKAVKNILLKSTVSPFSTTLAGFPDIQESPDHILFPPGEISLTSENEKTLQNLHTILTERPGLTVRIKGYASAKEDKDALLAKKEKAIDRRKIALEQVRSTILSESYGKELIQPAPPQRQEVAPTMEFRKPVVIDEELVSLAKKRQLVIRDFMSSTLKMPVERLISHGEGTIIPADAVGRSGSRADFTLGVK
jgi:hypothetical protein